MFFSVLNTHLLIAETHLPSRIAANIHATEEHAMLALETGGATSTTGTSGTSIAGR